MQAISIALPFLCLWQGPADASLSPILDGVRKAVNFQVENKSFKVRMTGESNESGVPGKVTFQFDGTGKWLNKTESALGLSSGFDGKDYWGTTRCGFVRSLSFASKDDSRFLYLLISHQWLRPNSGVDVALAPEQSEPDSYLMSLRLKDTGKEVKLVISKSTYLPVRATSQTSNGSSISTFGGWMSANGLKVPSSIAVEEAGVHASMLLKGIDTKPYDAKEYSRPANQSSDTAFDSKAPTKVETKRLASGHLMVHPLVNGKDVGWFFLDSGAEVMVIDKAAADALNLKAVGETVVGGIGGVGKSQFRTVPEFQLGPVTMKGRTFLELDLSAIGKALKMNIAGIVGHDFFYRSIVDISSATDDVNIYDPATFKLKVGSWTKMAIDGGLPSVQSRFDGGQGWFGIDTGSDAAVTFNAPAVKKLNLLDGRETTPTKFGGYGGFSDGRMGTLAWFELGNQRVEKLRAGYSQAKNGALANEYLTGSIGQQIIRQMRMTFDFSHERIAFLKL